MDILTAVIIVAVIGLVLGLGLAVASIVFAVTKDEKAEAVRECLPGANCGACGFSGCDGYANALAKGETDNTALCSPGGNAVSKDIATILGVEAGEVMPEAAVVLCLGHNGSAKLKYDYQGVDSCRMASQLYSGPKECVYGCLGLGDCVAACPYNAIHICNGVARINPLACRACKACIKTCPKGLIELMPLHQAKAAVLCVNHDKGALTRTECKAGCIGCMKCVKACEYDAVKVENFCAKVDYDKCIGCGKCHEACPVKAIDVIELGKIALKSINRI